ncbi:MAG TPA: DUF4395 domain-containing protein [Solirubrobacteraceae bacterium]|jgi:hypothetical protein|nr:DUF4395 domain-containing protein [Solirubrobacteraceae bacterium]
MLGFPNPVNEKAARAVAGGVLAIAVVALAAGWHWLLVPLALGFWARVLTGPRLSPLGRLATSVVAPRLGAPKYVPGPPKRFAQGIGAAVTTIGAVVGVALGVDAVAVAALAVIALAAGLESVLALCLGCQAFALLMRLGVVPERVCLECADVGRRYGGAAARP